MLILRQVASRRQSAIHIGRYIFQQSPTTSTSVTATSSLISCRYTSSLSPSSPSIVTSKVPQALGFGGVLPFAAGALITTVAPDFQLGVQATQLYGASILSFLGGIHWGIALRQPLSVVPSRDFIVSVVPSLIAWGSAVAAPQNGLAMLSSSFALLYVYDLFRLKSLSSNALIPSWYLPMRLPLTIAAAGGCGVAWLAVRRQTRNDDDIQIVEITSDEQLPEPVVMTEAISEVVSDANAEVSDSESVKDEIVEKEQEHESTD